MRYSTQREKIYEIVINSCDHPNAKTIYERTKKQIHNISLGTVYRNLNSLVENKMIKKVIVPSDSDRFDKTLCEHYHFYCIKCNNVYDMNLLRRKSIIEIIKEDSKNKINNFNILVDGICQNCLKEER